MITPLAIGQRATVTRTFTMDDVRAFAAVSGDTNPLHIDPDYAQHTSFGRPIVHGLLTASLFSRLMGMELPGPGTVYLGQMLTFHRPVYVGEGVTAVVEVTKIRQYRGIVTLHTTAITNEAVAIDGEAVVRVSRPIVATG